MKGADIMATSSFYADITIKDKKTAKNFLKAMEDSEKAPKKKINLKSKKVDDKETLRRMFLK